VLSCMLGVGVQIYMGVKSVFVGLIFGALRCLQTGSISMLAVETLSGVVFKI